MRSARRYTTSSPKANTANTYNACTAESMGLIVQLEPLAGMFIWVDGGRDTEVLVRQMAAQGVLLAPGVLFSANQQGAMMLRLSVSVVENEVAMIRCR